MNSKIAWRARARVGPGMAVDEFLFERGPERFGDRVVPALPGRSQALAHPVAPEEVTDRPRGVLAAPIGVEDQPRLAGAHRRPFVPS
jgi:hypothetical protein